MSDRKKRILSGVFFALLFSALIHFGTRTKGFVFTRIIDRYEYQSYDARLKAASSNTEEMSIDNVVIIDIEQNSVEALGNYHEWPHAYHGQLTDVVSSGNPDALLFDVIFDEKNSYTHSLIDALSQETTTPELQAATEKFLLNADPNRFVESTSQNSKVHHALVFETEDTLNFLYKMADVPNGYNDQNHTLKIPDEVAKHLPSAERIGNTYTELLIASYGVGAANFPQDEDGIIRRAPTAIHFKGPNKTYPSLALSAIKDILKIPDDGFKYDFENKMLHLIDSTGNIAREIPIDDKGRMFINYFGPHKTFYYIPYMYAFDAEMLDPAYWGDKTAIVGSSLPGLMDLRSVPVQETFPGVEIHANVIHSILENKFIQIKSPTANYFGALFLSIAIGVFTGAPKKPMFGFMFLATGAGLWIVFAYSQFLGESVMWEIIRPIFSITLTPLGVFSYTFLILDKDKRFLKTTFSTYISPKLIDQMVDGKTVPKLGGDEDIHTAVFTDIQEFSRFSEQLTPTELVELLNDYLTEMTNILLDNQGTLDKYIGDAIVAFYGAPVPVEDHEYKACLTALLMQKKLYELRKKWKTESKYWPNIVYNMQMRIGIHTGKMVTGNMGSKHRMNYTMMGDTVNLAARLESSAKQYGIYSQISEETYLSIQDRISVRELDHVRVFGKENPVKTYELISLRGQEPEWYKQINEPFAKGIHHFQKGEFEKAKQLFELTVENENMFDGRNINPSLLYVERCNMLIKKPPKEWDGIWSLTSKK